MSEAQAILIPLINPNEPEAHLAELYISEGQQVRKGELLCTLETTKTTFDLAAERDGFICQLKRKRGEMLSAGDLLCYLADQPDWTPAPAAQPSTQLETGRENAVPEGLRISQPALRLAQEAGLNLAALPKGMFITESLVQEMIGKSKQIPRPEAESGDQKLPFDPTAILVYGGGGHGKALIDLLKALKTYRIVGIIDDAMASEAAEKTIMGIPILGGAEVLPRLFDQGVRLAVNAVGGIGNIAVRVRVFERLAQAGFSCPAVVHPSAVVEPSATLAAGVQVFPLAYVGSEARVGFGAIINTGAIVSHDCQVDDYANLSPGAILAGEVQVGKGALIGMGVTVNLRTKIGSGARIGNGATIKGDVPDQGVVRAGMTYPE